MLKDLTLNTRASNPPAKPASPTSSTQQTTPTGTIRGTQEKITVLLADDHAVVREDRKSTRLNSSHPSISYAVFCLKKKKYTILTFSVFLHRPSPMITFSTEHLTASPILSFAYTLPASPSDYPFSPHSPSQLYLHVL